MKATSYYWVCIISIWSVSINAMIPCYKDDRRPPSIKEEYKNAAKKHLQKRRHDIMDGPRSLKRKLFVDEESVEPSPAHISWLTVSAFSTINFPINAAEKNKN